MLFVVDLVGIVGVEVVAALLSLVSGFVVMRVVVALNLAGVVSVVKLVGMVCVVGAVVVVALVGMVCLVGGDILLVQFPIHFPHILGHLRQVLFYVEYKEV